MGHAWHVGALAGVAEATGWDARTADLVVGTSAGAVTGAELRAGHHPLDLLRPGLGAAPATVPRPVLLRRSFRPAAASMVLHRLGPPARVSPGLVAAGLLPRGRRDAAIIGDAVASLVPDGAPWPVGLWVCATRLHDGERVVFTGEDGPDLPTAVAASCAMAGFFAPVAISGVDHVDGGSRSVTNADVVAGEQLDVVVVSAPMSIDPRGGARPRGVAARVAYRQRRGHAARLGRELAAVRARGTPVLALEPGDDDVAVLGSAGAAMDFARRAAVGEQARRSARRRLGGGHGADAAVLLEAAARAGAPGPGRR